VYITLAPKPGTSLKLLCRSDMPIEYELPEFKEGKPHIGSKTDRVGNRDHNIFIVIPDFEWLCTKCNTRFKRNIDTIESGQEANNQMIEHIKFCK
jgi:hypothetical protein